ncbi:MAG: P-type conjugative transfer protein TrbJ [Rhizobiales bacterium 24-66-13]|nr:MAG: P-type conjugative transfer protein TrbJ [Rhizobiales bacterium 24-66-13]OZB11984.1 MAG: P-type conjugative transfer protein TrbJ [Rhizobiales bacterium 39-66-18]HQS45174.1 P-type conjugative transfer protein TrbJ [Xanthobacteraceae bacterium]
MPKRCLHMTRLEILRGAAALTIALSVTGGFASTASGQIGVATEWTQLLNNGQLVSLVGKSAEQVNNQLRQITQLAEQIQNQLRIYNNLLQNTAQLPNHVWGQVANDLNRLQDVVTQGQGIAFSMSNIDDVLRQRFQSFADFRTSLPNGGSFSQTYQGWSATNRDTIAGTLRAANLTADQFSSEEVTLSQLRTMSQSADGQMKALQVGHQIAAQEVAQLQKLRGLVSQQMTMMATWYQSEQSEKDLAQARREDFFKAATPSTSGGQEMRPRW